MSKDRPPTPKDDAASKPKGQPPSSKVDGDSDSDIMEVDAPVEENRPDDGVNSSDSEEEQMNLSPGIHSSDESDHEDGNASPQYDVPKSPGKEESAEQLDHDTEPVKAASTKPSQSAKESSSATSSTVKTAEPKNSSTGQRRKVDEDDVVVLDKSPAPGRAPLGALVPVELPEMPPIFPSDIPGLLRGPGKYFRGQFGWCNYPLQVAAIRPTSFSDARRQRLEEFLDGLITRGFMTSHRKDDILKLWITRANALTAPRQGRLDPDHQYYLMRLLCSHLKGLWAWQTRDDGVQGVRFILNCYLLDMMPDDLIGSTQRMPPEAEVPALGPITSVPSSPSDTLTPLQAKDSNPVTPVSSRNQMLDYQISTVEKRKREVSKLLSASAAGPSNEPKLPNAPFVDPNTGMIAGCPLDHAAWEALPADRRQGLRETRHWLPQPKGSSLTQHRPAWLCPTGSYCDSNKTKWKSYKNLCEGDIPTTLSNHRRYAVLLCEYRHLLPCSGHCLPAPAYSTVPFLSRGR